VSSSESVVVTTTTQDSLQRRALRLLLTTQTFFFVALAWCVLLVHDHAAQNAGISYYGTHHNTVPYAIIGYVAAAIGVWRASALFRAGGADVTIWFGLRFVAVMLVVLLVTPYNEGTFLNWTHMTIGGTGALVQLWISATFIRRLGTLSSVLGFTVQLLGGVLGALSLPDWRFQYLLNAEIVLELGFCWCLLEGTRLLTRRDATRRCFKDC